MCVKYARASLCARRSHWVSEWVSECICDTPTGIWLVVTKDRAYILRLPFIIKNHRGARQRIHSISSTLHAPNNCARPSTEIAWRAHIHCTRATRARQRGRKPAQTHRVSYDWKIYWFIFGVKGLEVAPKRAYPWPTQSHGRLYPHECRSLQRVCEERRSIQSWIIIIRWYGQPFAMLHIFHENTLPFVVPMWTQTAAVQFVCVYVCQPRSKRNGTERKKLLQIFIRAKISERTRIVIFRLNVVSDWK